MLIDPLLQGKLYVLSLLCGLGLGFLWDAVLVLRVLTGAGPKSAQLAALYQRPLPLLGRAVGFSTKLVHRVWQDISLAFWQVLFPVLGAITVLLLCFGYNSGVFRLPVLVLLAVGFALWRRLLSGHVARGLSLVAFFLSALVLYLRALLCLPVRVIQRLFCRFVFMPLRALLVRWHRKRLQSCSKRLCAQQLEAAACGLLFSKQTLKRKRKLKLCQIKKEGAVSRP